MDRVHSSKEKSGATKAEPRNNPNPNPNPCLPGERSGRVRRVEVGDKVDPHRSVARGRISSVGGCGDRAQVKKGNRCRRKTRGVVEAKRTSTIPLCHTSPFPVEWRSRRRPAHLEARAEPQRDGSRNGAPLRSGRALTIYDMLKAQRILNDGDRDI